ncbi:MAG TPA: L-threonylcarbamoyladenylate synthase [Candidatus Saccharimonadales bacterium]|nr:L-threonylcarbamoyladenylate synthase [Candidatus Saccharimonadales bacterium]
MVIVTSLHDPQLPPLYAGGAVGVIPTDTIYGLSAAAHLPAAVDKLYKLKHREQKPGTVIASSVEQLHGLGISAEYLDAVAHLWPNPLSIELPVPASLDYLGQGTGHCAFRVVADPEVRQLLEQTGPLLTSSANHPGQPAANNIAEALAYFSDQVGFYVDGGERTGRPPSTVARLRLPVDGTLDIIRLGAVNITEQGEVQ